MKKLGGQTDPEFLELTRELCAIRSGIVDHGNEDLFRRMGQEIPLRMFRFPSGQEHNGWVIPDAWRVKRATISKDGLTIYDGTASHLGVAYYSRSFSGSIELPELKKHLFSNAEIPDAQMWHCSWLYKPWLHEWGMTPPHRFIEGLQPGIYDVVLQTEFNTGDMLVADYHIQGEEDATFVFQSHTCHPYMANDGFAGTAVLIRLMQYLKTRRNRLSYRLVLGPEHFSTIFYLRDIPQIELDRIVCGVFPEMIGTGGPLKMGTTFWGDHYLDMALGHVGRFYAKNFERLPFRQTVGNDETVWEAPGYEIPFAQMNRSARFGFPFAEYHSTLDTPDVINASDLDEAFDVLRRAVDVIETDRMPKRKFSGLMCLANPRRDLYRQRADPSMRETSGGDESEKWGYLQDCIVRYMEGSMSILEIAERHGLPYFDVLEYLQNWQRKDLIEFRPFSFGRTTRRTVEPVRLSWIEGH